LVDSLAGLFLLQLRQSLHQAAFAPGGVVLVQNAFLGGFIQGADCQSRSLNGIVDIAIGNLDASFPNKGAGAPAEIPVAQPALLILPVPFNLRLDIRQSDPPKTNL
jgi:hypothetical protein